MSEGWAHRYSYSKPTYHLMRDLIDCGASKEFVLEAEEAFVKSLQNPPCCLCELEEKNNGDLVKL